MIDIKTELSRCLYVKFVPTTDVNKNEFTSINNIYGFSLTNVKNGEEGIFIVECPICEVEAYAGNYSVGQDVFIDQANPNMPVDNIGGTGKVKIGKVFQDASFTANGILKIIFRQSL